MTIHAGPHMRWRREGHLPFERLRLQFVALVDGLLDRLENEPDFPCIQIDRQTILLDDYLELRPQEERRLALLIQAGRIHTGPWYTLPDECLVTGEALVRNLAAGRRTLRRFGSPAPHAYLVECGGLVDQMPQVLRNAGIDTAIVWREVEGEEAECWWEGVDGSRVLLRHLPPDAPCTALRPRGENQDRRLQTIRGELRSSDDRPHVLLAGALSARMDIKQANARIEHLLERWAEPLAAFASTLGAAYPADELRHAWTMLLQNHCRDTIGGRVIDAVHDESMTRFARAQHVGEGVGEAAAGAIVRAIAPAGHGIRRCVAVNTGAYPFKGVLEATIDLPIDATVAAVRSHDGRVVPLQVLDEAFGLAARRLRVLWPGEVPGCGYAAFDLLADEAVPAPPLLRPVVSAARSAENEYLRVSINDDGTVDVVDRRTGARHARCGALEDAGDVGDAHNYSPPGSNPLVTSDHAADVRIARVHEGPLRAAFRIDLSLPIPEAAAPDRLSRGSIRVASDVSALVSLDAGSPRVTWNIVIANRSKDHRLRMIFPAGGETLTDVRADSAFGIANGRPAGDGSMRYFVDGGGNAIGATILGVGLTEYEAYPRDEIAGPRLGVTLLRCVGDLSRDDLAARPSGHGGPAAAAPGAQCLGAHTFRIAFEPRGGPPSAAALFARSAAFASSPHVVCVPEGGGARPDIGSFLTIETSRGGAVLSACKCADDRRGLIVRLFNPDDVPATVRVRAVHPVRHAWFVDFLEERTQEVPVRDGAVEIALAHHVIRTVELEL